MFVCLNGIDGVEAKHLVEFDAALDGLLLDAFVPFWNTYDTLDDTLDLFLRTLGIAFQESLLGGLAETEHIVVAMNRGGDDQDQVDFVDYLVHIGIEGHFA